MIEHMFDRGHPGSWPAVEIRATMRQRPDGSWAAATQGERPVSVQEPTRERCLTSLRRSLEWARVADDGGPVTLVVEVAPRLAGVTEAAQIMGWDRRRVFTYIRRGSFPEPLQGLASGRGWLPAAGAGVAPRGRERPPAAPAAAPRPASGAGRPS